MNRTVGCKTAQNRNPCVRFSSVTVLYTGNVLGPSSNCFHNYTPCLQAEFSIRNTKTCRGVMTTDTVIIAYFLHSYYISLSIFFILLFPSLTPSLNKRHLYIRFTYFGRFFRLVKSMYPAHIPASPSLHNVA